MKRVASIGAGGAGKSWLARELGRCLELATMAGLPEGRVELLVARRRIGGEELERACGHPQRGRPPQPIDACAPVDEQPRHVPAAVADSVGELTPPAIEPPRASMSAPPSIRAIATSTSSLLAAQCSGVSDGPWSLGLLGSAPASISSRTTSGPLRRSIVVARRERVKGSAPSDRAVRAAHAAAGYPLRPPQAHVLEPRALPRSCSRPSAKRMTPRLRAKVLTESAIAEIASLSRLRRLVPFRRNSQLADCRCPLPWGDEDIIVG
jgi:hypothetical protein